MSKFYSTGISEKIKIRVGLLKLGVFNPLLDQIPARFGVLCKQCRSSSNAASDQGLHCLNITISMGNAFKMKITIRDP